MQKSVKQIDTEEKASLDTMKSGNEVLEEKNSIFVHSSILFSECERCWILLKTFTELEKPLIFTVGNLVGSRFNFIRC